MSNTSQRSRQTAIALVVLVGLSLAVRLYLLATLHDAPYVAGMAQGELAYAITTGKGFIHGGLPGCGIQLLQAQQNRLIDVEDYLKHYQKWCREAPSAGGSNGEAIKVTMGEGEPFIAYMMPGPGLLLAGTYYLFGHHRYIYLQVIQAVLDSLGVLMIWSIGIRHFSYRVAVVAGFLYAVNLPEARIAIAGGLRDAWMPILLLATLYCFLRSAASGVPAVWSLCTGACVGVACYFRPTILPIPLLFAFLMVLTRRGGLREAMKMTAVMCLAVVLLLAPWWIRNYQVFHRFIPTNAGYWMAVWQGFGESPNPVGAKFNDGLTYTDYLRADGKASYFSPEFADDYFRPKVLAVVRRYPGWAASLLVRRVMSSVAYQTAPGKTVIGTVARNTFTISLFLLLVAGVWLHGPPWKESALILSVLTFNIGVHVFTSVFLRYLIPGHAAALLFAGVVVVHFADTKISRSEVQ